MVLANVFRITLFWKSIAHMFVNPEHIELNLFLANSYREDGTVNTVRKSPVYSFGTNPGRLPADRSWHINTDKRQAGCTLSWLTERCIGFDLPLLFWGYFAINKCYPWLLSTINRMFDMSYILKITSNGKHVWQSSTDIKHRKEINIHRSGDKTLTR